MLGLGRGGLRQGWETKHGATGVSLGLRPCCRLSVVFWSGWTSRWCRSRRVINVGSPWGILRVASVVRWLGRLGSILVWRWRGVVGLLLLHWQWWKRLVLVQRTAMYRRVNGAQLAGPLHAVGMLGLEVDPYALPRVPSMLFLWFAVKLEVDSDEPLSLHAVQVCNGDAANICPGAVDEGVVIKELATKNQGDGEQAEQLLFGPRMVTQLVHACRQVEHAEEDGSRGQASSAKDLVDPFAERGRSHAGWHDQLKSHFAHEVGHDVHIVIELRRDSTDGFLFLGSLLLSDALSEFLHSVKLLVQILIAHGVRVLHAHGRQDGGTNGLVEGAGGREARLRVTHVCSGLRVHGRHRDGELAVAVCKVETVVLLPNGGLTKGSLLVWHSSAASLVARHKLGRRKGMLPGHVVSRVEGRHDCGMYADAAEQK